MIITFSSKLQKHTKATLLHLFRGNVMLRSPSVDSTHQREEDLVDVLIGLRRALDEVAEIQSLAKSLAILSRHLSLVFHIDLITSQQNRDLHM